MQLSVSTLPVVCSVSGRSVQRARSASAVTACVSRSIKLSSRSCVAARGSARVQVPHVSERFRARAAQTVSPQASMESFFKQNKEHLQWITIFATFASIVAVAAPMAMVAKGSLLTVASVALGASGLWMLVEVVGDWIRERNNEKNGVKEAWMAKANAVALAARARASNGPTMKANNWLERNVAGAASEEDAKLIRSMNEFLGVEADK